MMASVHKASSQPANLLTAEEIRKRKFLKKGLQLSILLLGETGTGKSTFVNTLCDANLLPTCQPSPAELVIETHHTKLSEGDTQISLDITMCPGFGDYVNNDTSTNKIIQHLEDQFESILNEECRIKRNLKFKDTRIHAVLYFIRPTSKGLSTLDIFCLKELSSRCNIIPIIAKADSLTCEETALNRKLIASDIKANKIQIYDFSTCFDEIEEEESESIMQMVPFAMISGTEKRIIDEVEYKVRTVPHGIIRVDDPSHSDFLILRTCLLGACLQDLKENTHNVYYERYRSEMLSKSKTLNSYEGLERENLTSAFASMALP